jgi:hypothetical protein
VPLSRNGSIAFTSNALDQDADFNVYLDAYRVALVAPDGTRTMISEGREATFSPDGQVLAIVHTGGEAGAASCSTAWTGASWPA